MFHNGPWQALDLDYMITHPVFPNFSTFHRDFQKHKIGIVSVMLLLYLKLTTFWTSGVDLGSIWEQIWAFWCAKKLFQGSFTIKKCFKNFFGLFGCPEFGLQCYTSKRRCNLKACMNAYLKFVHAYASLQVWIIFMSWCHHQCFYHNSIKPCAWKSAKRHHFSESHYWFGWIKYMIIMGYQQSQSWHRP
jgi:hypothetical protein